MEPTAALTPLSTAVQKAAQTPGVQYAEICEVVVNLGIIPGKPVPQAPVEVTYAEAGLKEQGGILQALILDMQDILMERVSNTCIEDINHSDNECELLNDNEGIERTRVGRVRGVMLPSPCVQLSSLFGPLDHFPVSFRVMLQQRTVFARPGCPSSKCTLVDYRGNQTRGNYVQHRDRSLQYGTALSA